jgi:hypothetical protein
VLSVFIEKIHLEVFWVIFALILLKAFDKSPEGDWLVVANWRQSSECGAWTFLAAVFLSSHLMGTLILPNQFDQLKLTKILGIIFSLVLFILAVRESSENQYVKKIVALFWSRGESNGYVPVPPVS